MAAEDARAVLEELVLRVEVIDEVDNLAARAFETSDMAAKDEGQSDDEVTTRAGFKKEDVNPMVTWAADEAVVTALLLEMPEPTLEVPEVVNFEA